MKLDDLNYEYPSIFEEDFYTEGLKKLRSQQEINVYFAQRFTKLFTTMKEVIEQGNNSVNSINALNSCINILNEWRTDVDKNLVEIKQRQTQVETGNNDFKAGVNETLELFRNNVTTNQNNVDKLSTSLNKLALEFAQFKNTLDMDKINTLIGLYDEIQEDINSRFESLEKDLRVENEQFKKQIENNLIEEINICNNRISNLQYRIDELNQYVASMIQKQQEEIASFKKTFTLEITELLNKQISEVKKDFDARMDAEIQVRYKEDCKLSKEIKTLKEQHDSDMADLTIKVVNLSTRLTDEINRVDGRIDECFKELCNLNKTVNQVIQTHKIILDRLTNVETRQNNQDIAIAELHKDMGKFRKELNDMKKYLDDEIAKYGKELNNATAIAKYCFSKTHLMDDIFNLQSFSFDYNLGVDGEEMIPIALSETNGITINYVNDVYELTPLQPNSFYRFLKVEYKHGTTLNDIYIKFSIQDGEGNNIKALNMFNIDGGNLISGVGETASLQIVNLTTASKNTSKVFNVEFYTIENGDYLRVIGYYNKDDKSISLILKRR